MKRTYLEKIEILNIAGRKEIRIDWSNDRNLSVSIKNNDPQSVVEALQTAIFLIKDDIYSGYLK